MNTIIDGEVEKARESITTHAQIKFKLWKSCKCEMKFSRVLELAINRYHTFGTCTGWFKNVL